MSVAIRLTDDVDVSRGDMICRPGNQPEIGQDIDAMVCWMADKALVAGARYGLKHTTRSVGRLCETSATGSTSTPCTGTRRRATYPQPGRAHHPAHHRPPHVRRLPPQPQHGQLHPDRRGHQRHRRRRDDPRPPLVAGSASGCLGGPPAGHGQAVRWGRPTPPPPPPRGCR